MPNLKKTTLFVKGMHCPSCEVLISDKFKEEGNVKQISANYNTQKVEVSYLGQLNIDHLNQKIKQYGYQIVKKEEQVSREPLSKRLFDAGAIAIIIFILYFFAGELKLIPDFQKAISLNYLSVFLLGLVASTSTCMATSGALFLATVGRSGRLGPAISFNLGRVLSYGAFGFVFGIFGQAITNNFQLGNFLTLLISIFMVFIALDMLQIFSWQKLLPYKVTNSLFENIKTKLIKNPQKTAFFIGAITYLLPCGFTQTVQLYSLGLADPVKSGVMMMMFALGTVPALMAIGVASSFTKSTYYNYFMKIIGVIVLLVGISYFGNFLHLEGVNLELFGSGQTQVAGSNTGATGVKVENGKQIIKMDVDSSGYSPNNFVIKNNQPVKWVINGVNVFGCQGYLVSKKLGVQQALNAGENVIEFTPHETGTINFSCGMGMYRGKFEVVEG